MDALLKRLIKELYEYIRDTLKIQGSVKISIRRDIKNSKDPLGKTAHFDINNNTIVLYITGRHVKDILRSLAHEMYHFYQKENGQFDQEGDLDTEEGYAQNDSLLREIEKEAYEKGSILFRDWEDSVKAKRGQ